MSDSGSLALGSEFPPVSREAWIKRVEQVLRGRTLESLRTVTADGITLEPLYEPRAALPVPSSSRGGRPWDILQRIDHPDANEANVLATDDLAGGVSGLVLTFAGAQSARGFGLRSCDPKTLALALRNVELHTVPLKLDAGPWSIEAADALDSLLSQRSLGSGHLKVSFGMDPAAALVAGNFNGEWPGLVATFTAAAKSLAARYAGPFAEADGRPFHEAGAGEAQEIGASLAVAVSYLRELCDHLPEAALARAVGMTLAADQDVFLGIAKFRAARMLWGRVLSVCGLPGEPLRLHAETSWRMMTRRDLHTNLLRSVTAAFAAGLGGAGSLTVLPFTAVHGLADGFARRLARNMQNILLAESNLARVADPGAGAGYVECLTAALAEKAWSFFQAIEEKGGIIPALRSGFVQGEIAKAAERRAKRLESGEQKIIGTTDFTLPSEGPPAVLMKPADPLANG